MENCRIPRVFQVGDKVFIHTNGHTSNGEVVDVYEMPISPERKSWLVVVSDGEQEYAYAPRELSLIPDESEEDANVIYVNFQTKKRLQA